ncbi:hypothetical protein [Dyadobacter chenhuakuii]|uniref:Outer membrane protein beta-barrel domain-containing protein n=1 Tax=Dyadobacter chenhuakuii TaxID=2909339 RepID=A0A9X1QC25_9BACT|nr:hypothetical protein [Dyadobacter chenhuakuii]MCF2497687.1 hypothetical protein [Dyadobacter chenhuakuii]
MKKIILLLIFLTPLTSSAQIRDDVDTKRKWFMPDHIKLQFAGNIGFLSGGPGYISRNKTLETDLLFGFLPQKFGGDGLVSTTLKTTYSPWSIPLKSDYYIKPFSLGFYLSYTFGTQFNTKLPEHYPVGYYWWATSFRPGAYIGGKIGKDVSIKNRQRSVEMYYELGTYDLLLISYVQNTGYLRPSDIVNLALGVRFGF